MAGTSTNGVEMLINPPVIGILRGIDEEFFGEVMQVAFAAGLAALEVTMNTRNAVKMIADFRPAVPGGKLLGMGTVRNISEARRALDAGAMFLVTPNCDTEVIEFAASQGIPVISGALTPTEVWTAWSAGAALVKVFPVKSLGGPAYIRELKGPYDKVKLIAVGGVTRSNVREYFEAGADGVGVGNTLFGGRALEERDLAAIGESVRSFLAAATADDEHGMRT